MPRILSLSVLGVLGRDSLFCYKTMRLTKHAVDLWVRCGLSSIFLASIFLTSCISVAEDSKTPASQQNFVTATLVFTKAQFIPATLTITPESLATPTLAKTVPTNCTNAAILLRDVTIQDDTHVNAGEKFTKTREFQNTGTCPWMDYTIKFSADDPMNAPLSAPIADTLPSGKVQVSVDLTAPTGDGKYAGYFTLLNSKGEIISIGTQKTFWVKFTIGAYGMIPTASGVNPTQSRNCIHSQNADYVNQIISLINTERANAGLPALTANAQIAAFSQSHAEDMAFNNFFGHDGSDGSFSDRMFGYNATHSDYKIYGKTLAIGAPQNAMDQWRKDEHWNFVLGEGLYPNRRWICL